MTDKAGSRLPASALSRHILLVGLPGSGKSTVGRLVATMLGVEAIDIDREVELTGGHSIPDLFDSRGEAWFRSAERRATERALVLDSPRVIVPGAGWAAQPGHLETVGDRALVVYLEISPEVAVRRVTAGSRPLLSGSDPVAQMRALLAQREVFYHRAHCRVSVLDHPADAVARKVVELARRAPPE